MGSAVLPQKRITRCWTLWWEALSSNGADMCSFNIVMVTSVGTPSDVFSFGDKDLCFFILWDTHMVDLPA